MRGEIVNFDARGVEADTSIDQSRAEARCRHQGIFRPQRKLSDCQQDSEPAL